MERSLCNSSTAKPRNRWSCQGVELDSTKIRRATKLYVRSEKERRDQQRPNQSMQPRKAKKRENRTNKRRASVYRLCSFHHVTYYADKPIMNRYNIYIYIYIYMYIYICFDVNWNEICMHACRLHVPADVLAEKSKDTRCFSSVNFRSTSRLCRNDEWCPALGWFWL